MDVGTAREIASLDAHDQRDLVRRGDVAPGDLVEAALMRIERSTLNAVSLVAAAPARAAPARIEADAAMAFVPWLAKDSLDCPGLPTACASAARSRDPAVHGYPLVNAIDAAGMILLGKSTMPEFALAPATEGLLYGPTRNPWVPDHTPGGSSGGAAAAVAAGLVPFAHASDGGGSIRIPAACCGLIGYKPGRGYNRRARAPHIVEDMICGDALLARNARDTVWAARMLRPARVPVAAPYGGRLRIGVIVEAMDGAVPHPEVAAAVAATARRLDDLGHEIVSLHWPAALAGTVDAFVTMWGYLAREAVSGLGDPAADETATLVEPWTLGLARSMAEVPGPAIEAFYAMMATTAAVSADMFATVDVLLTPVVSTPPPATGWLAPTCEFGLLRDRMFSFVAYTPLQNLAGLPSVSVPGHVTADGLPVGAMLTAGRGRDDMLLDLLAPLEEASGWARTLSAMAARTLRDAGIAA